MSSCGCAACGHDHGHDHALDSATEQRRAIARLLFTFLGGAFVINSYLAQLFFYFDQERAQYSAMIGAIMLGGPLVYSAIKELARGRLRMSELAALAVASCFVLEMYTESGLVAFFLMLAELVESRTAMGARASIEELLRLTPRRARLADSGKEIDISELKVGDVVLIRPGENIPADGIICKGESSLNEASVTGESLPVDKGSDDQVYAGTNNITGAIEVRVDKVGDDTTLGRVHKLILDAERTRLPILAIIDKHVQWYTPTIIMVAAFILFFTHSATSAIAALVVACPCAIVMATPTAMVAGLTAAARLGILIKNVTHLESAGEITAIVCDKTGTLTTGELEVTRLSPAQGVDAGDLLRYAASAERHSNHPVARAMVKVAAKAGIKLADPEKTIEHGGRGLEAEVEGKKVLVGRESWLSGRGVDFSNLPAPERAESEGFSNLYVSVAGKVLGWVGLEDHTRPDARQATDELKNLGIHNITMLTGDRWGVARRVASELGCTDVVAECLPERKLELVEAMKKKGLRVAVVGDGVNDAPALAAGDLGIAMGAAGSDVAVNSASIALMNNDLRRLPFLIRLSRLTRSVVYQNLLFGVIFILVGLALSASQNLTPIQAALYHLLGSLPVIFNSARIVRHGEELAPHAPVVEG